MITENDHARQNAKGWAETIAALVAALECDYDRLEELRDERADLVQQLESASGESTDGDQSPNEATAKAELDTWDEENGEELAELVKSSQPDGDAMKDADEARERIQEGPLSVEVRSGWTSPGETMEAEDFCILLSTGGPALRIRGELDQYKQPCRAWLEYQDWGTPWTEYHGDGCENSTLLTYCRQFYFGD